MFGLTSASLAWILAVLAAGLLGLVLWGWPRLAGPGVARIALRLVALCLVQASVLALVLVIVNSTGGFYSSWSDLLGRYTGGGTLSTVHEGSFSGSAGITVVNSVPVSIPGKVHSEGILETVLIHGPESGLTFRGRVYLPPGYPREGRRMRYPVVVAISSPQAAPARLARLVTVAAEQMTAGRLKPLVLVTLPAGPGSDLGCLNLPGGPQAALFFSEDLPAAIGSRYAVSTGRGGWALLGDATAGYCALQLVLTNAQVFSAAAVPQGSYAAPPGPPPWGNSPQLRLQDNLAWLVQHQPVQPVSVLFTGPGRPGLTLATASRVRSRSSALMLDWLGRVLSATSVSLASR